MGLRLAVDWDQNDWVPLFALSTDAPNQLRFETAGLEASANITAYARAFSSGSVTTSLNGRYTADRAKYGKGILSWSPSATVVQQMFIGTNLAGTDNAHLVAAGSVITGTLWARIGVTVADTWALSLFNIVTGTIIATSTPQTISATVSQNWHKLTVSAAAVGATSQYALVLERVSGTSTSTVNITGAMIVDGATSPAYYNSGPTSLTEVITNYWMSGRWELGSTRPYFYVAATGKAELTLRNDDKRFSPEYASGPFFGELKPNLLVQIGDPDYGIWWTGWVDRWKPEPGTSRSKRATLSATDARRFLEQRPPVQLYTSPLPHGIVVDLRANYSIPNTTSGFHDVTDGTSGWYSMISELTAIASYGEGIPYDWSGVKVFTDLMTGSQGHAWFSRVGGLLATTQQGDDTPASYTTLSDTIWMEADYADERIINHCEAIAHIRKTQSGTFTLWELEEQIVLSAGEVEQFRVFFEHDTNPSKKIGAETLTVTGTLSAGTFGTTVTAVLSDISATSAVLTLTNTAAGSRTVLTAVVSASTRVTIKREISKEYEDSASVTANGTLGERLDSLYIQSRLWAKKLARYTVNRFKDPRQIVPWVRLHADKRPAEAFACFVSAPVRVTDTQTAHDEYYAVIGEQHTVGAGLKDHTVKVYLEPLYGTSVEDTAV